MTSKSIRRVLLAAFAATPLIAALPASAQFQAQQDGRAHDANNRVGSGGVNEGGTGGGSNVTSNDIIYRNVTGGRGFRGFLPDRDPQAFTGPIPRGLDSFVRNSSSAPQPYQPSFDLSAPQPFFGQSRGVAPPVGSVRLGFTGSYLGTSLIPGPEEATANNFNSSLVEQYTQPLGSSVVLGSRSRTLGVEPSDMMLQGPLEAGNQQTILTGSPLYGVRQWRAGETPTDTDALSAYGSSGLLGDRFRMDDQLVRQMRAEMYGLAKPQQPNQQDQLNNNVQGNQPNGSPQNLGSQQNLTNPLEAPQNQSIQNTGGGPLTQKPLTSSINTNESNQLRLTSTLTANQISPQYGELSKRLERYQNPQAAQLEANHQFQLDQRNLQARQGAPGSVAGGTGLVPGAGAGHTGPATQPAGAGALGEPEAPVKVHSIAEGVKAKGLHDTLQAAENLMKEGKYTSAMDRYNLAARAAPGNGLVLIGRANAELAAGYYAFAAADLRRTVLVDRRVLMGQYDLNNMMKPDRLQFIQRDLEDLAKNQKEQEMPALLLAYIAYNTDKPADAARWLDEAQTRAGKSDPVIDLMKTHWSLKPSERREDEPNK